MTQKRGFKHGPVTHKKFNKGFLFGRKLLLTIKGEEGGEMEFDTGLMVPGFKSRAGWKGKGPVYAWKHRDRNKYKSDGSLR